MYMCLCACVVLEIEVKKKKGDRAKEEIRHTQMQLNKWSVSYALSGKNHDRCDLTQ